MFMVKDDILNEEMESIFCYMYIYLSSIVDLKSRAVKKIGEMFAPAGQVWNCSWCSSVVIITSFNCVQ